eukprot:6630132-Prorocentrum_lima.AAC.1
MTSSLVGSEMCIRDRCERGPVAGGARERDPRGVAVVSGAYGRRCMPMPVSYTHLTLPTICSV